MALVKCGECGAEVSSEAETCPKCGARVKAKPMGCFAKLVVVFLGFVILSTLIAIFGVSDLPPVASSPTIADTPPVMLPGQQWSYSHDKDQMTGRTTDFAIVRSSNTVRFQFPYAGTQHGSLTLRTHPRHGKDVIFQIERGQVMCRSYEDCSILVRFDDAPPVRYAAVGASDNSTETIFIRGYSKFVERLSKAEKVLISIEIYRQGSPTFEFDVRGFDPAKYRPRRG